MRCPNCHDPGISVVITEIEDSAEWNIVCFGCGFKANFRTPYKRPELEPKIHELLGDKE